MFPRSGTFPRKKAGTRTAAVPAFLLLVRSVPALLTPALPTLVRSVPAHPPLALAPKREAARWTSLAATVYEARRPR